MKVQGYEVPAKAESALLEWMRGKNGGWTFMNATEVLIRAGCNADYSERAADRILQRQRKAGLIKYVHGFWRKKRVMSRDDWPQSTPAQSEFVE